MKCPFCQQELYSASINGDWLECWNCSYNEPDPHHLPQHALMGTKILWQELIATKKSLDVAVDALKEISLKYQNELDKPVAPAKWFSAATDMCDFADNAIEQINQKENQ